jgi:hypothetical protein
VLSSASCPLIDGGRLGEIRGGYARATRAGGAGHHRCLHYTAAKEIGFDKVNGELLDQYFNTKTGVHLPLSRELTNPGPTTSPQSKQVYGQLVQWKDGKINVIQQGTEDGWISGS